MSTKHIFASGLALAGTALAISTATPANALSFNWSFVASPFSTGQAGQTISGTISGLVEGDNDGTGLTITVDSTPTGQLLGGGWTFVDTSITSFLAFTVTDGNITYADASYTRAGGEILWFGGFGGSPTSLSSVDNNPRWLTFSPNTFTPLAPATPEPGSVVALLGLGALSLAGRKLKR